MITATSFKAKYVTVSQVFLQLVVALMLSLDSSAKLMAKVYTEFKSYLNKY